MYLLYGWSKDVVYCLSTARVGQLHMRFWLWSRHLRAEQQTACPMVVFMAKSPSLCCVSGLHSVSELRVTVPLSCYNLAERQYCDTIAAAIHRTGTSLFHCLSSRSLLLY